MTPRGFLSSRNSSGPRFPFPVFKSWCRRAEGAGDESGGERSGGARDSAPSPVPMPRIRLPGGHAGLSTNEMRGLPPHPYRTRIKSSLLEQAERREPKAYGRGHSAGNRCPH